MYDGEPLNGAFSFDDPDPILYVGEAPGSVEGICSSMTVIDESHACSTDLCDNDPDISVCSLQSELDSIHCFDDLGPDLNSRAAVDHQNQALSELTYSRCLHSLFIDPFSVATRSSDVPVGYPTAVCSVLTVTAVGSGVSLVEFNCAPGCCNACRFFIHCVITLLELPIGRQMTQLEILPLSAECPL